MNTQISVNLQRLLIQKSIDMPVNTTIADVVMWLYEKHGIWVYSKMIVWSYLDKMIRFNYNIVKLIDTGRSPSKEVNSEYAFINSQLSTEAAIEYCLTKLI